MSLLDSFARAGSLSHRLAAWLDSLSPAQLAVLEQVLGAAQLVALVELGREVGAPLAPRAQATRARSCACGRCLSLSQESLLDAIGLLSAALHASLTPTQREALRERAGPAEGDVFEPFELRGAPPPVGQA
ncbi:MAG: hypothetical protein K8H88_25215 [Sandaracinaceae bacterium]|nr:hypothetical protein [Sandaracinaceae bacterium]